MATEKKRFYEDKSAYRTALVGALDTALRVADTLEQHELTSGGGGDAGLIAVRELIVDAQASVSALRDKVEALL